jgi:hypothetical protein
VNVFTNAGNKPCPHNVIRKKRTADPHEYETEKYVCGSCAQLFDVHRYDPPGQSKPQSKPQGRPEPMFDRRPPWGERNRQA